MLRFSLRTMLLLVFTCAAGIALFVHFYVPPIDRIRGLEKMDDVFSDSQAIRFNGSETFRTVEQLVANMEVGSSLWFTDTQCPHSEPEVDVMVQRCGTEFITTFSAHHWQSKAFPLSRSELAQYLWACRDDNKLGAKLMYDDGGAMHFFPPSKSNSKLIERDTNFKHRIYVLARNQLERIEANDENNSQRRDVSVIHRAAAGNHRDIVRAFIDVGADAEATGTDGNRLIERAVAAENWEMVELINTALMRRTPPLNEIYGLQLVDPNDTSKFFFLPTAIRETVEQMLVHVRHSNSSLSFFDTTYDSPSDPGAFVYLIHDRGKYSCRFSNHGWQGRWFTLRQGEVESYLWACRHDNEHHAPHSYLGGVMTLNSSPSAMEDYEYWEESQHAAHVRERIRQVTIDDAQAENE